MSKAFVTQKQIAEALGVSTQTVSLALRGHQKLPEATRERVQQKADELGYIPDPGMRALADYRASTRQAATRWNEVALVHHWSSVEKWETDSFYQRWFQSLEAAAHKRGIAIRVFWLGSKGERIRRVFKQLRNRGITGVFVAPPDTTLKEPELTFPQTGFQMVTFGPEHLYRDLHTVQFDFYENMRLAWKTLWEKGHRRIGLAYWSIQGWRTGHAWLAAYQLDTSLAGSAPGDFRPLILPNKQSDNPDVYRNWVAEHRLDAVISSVYDILTWNEALEAPPEVAMFNVTQPGQQGIDLNLPNMGEIAMDLLYGEMQASLLNQQRIPFRIHVPGKWVET